MTNDSLHLAKELIEFIDLSPSPYHAVKQCIQMLKQSGYKELNLDQSWSIDGGNKFYITRQSLLIAFCLGTETPDESGFRIISSHSDSPSWKLKPNSTIVSEGKYLKLNTEVYGGPILSTWMDRPLSIAGRVISKGSSAMQPNQQLVNFDRPLLVIPNLAIHLNRSVNEGIELNKQIDMLPLAGIVDDKDSSDEWLLKQLSIELNIPINDIIDYDLFLYPYEPGTILGINNEFISAPRIDNLAMVHASLTALINAEQSRSTQIVSIFDNEEVGSVSKQGAGSPILRHLIERLLFKLDKNTEQLQMAIYKSFMISADMAHALHPNRPEKHDPVLKPVINKGPVIKIHAGQKYTTDGESGAILSTIFENAGVPYQKYANRSDIAGGSTLGNISTTQLDIKTADMGNPMLSMHSARELSGTHDHLWATQAFIEFYEGAN